jgi:hypothetical protein
MVQVSPHPTPLIYERPLTRGEIRIEPFADGVRLVTRSPCPQARRNAVKMSAVTLMFLLVMGGPVAAALRRPSPIEDAVPYLVMAGVIAILLVTTCHAWIVLGRGGTIIITATRDGVELTVPVFGLHRYGAAAVDRAAAHRRGAFPGHELVLFARKDRVARSFRLDHGNRVHWEHVTLITHLDGDVLARAADAINGALTGSAAAEAP